MDNEVLKNLYNHVSVREYQEKPVEDSVLDKILRAACSGSTMGNMQLFSIIVTRDQAMKEKLAPFHFNQPMATSAPLILTFCADFRRFNRFCECRNANNQAYNNMQAYQWAVTDALIGAQNACVAAESLGTITFNVDKFVKALELPQNVVPVACITFGYPLKKQPLTQKLNFKDLVHYETYTDYSDDNIETIYREKELSEESKKVMSENPDLQNIAQVITQRRYVQKDNEFFSNVLIETLNNQGFKI